MNKYDRFFNNDIDGGFLWLFDETREGKLGFYTIFPYLAKERIDSLASLNNGYDKEKNKKLKQLIDDLNEDDNDLLYFFHLK